MSGVVAASTVPFRKGWLGKIRPHLQVPSAGFKPGPILLGYYALLTELPGASRYHMFIDLRQSNLEFQSYRTELNLIQHINCH